MMFQNTAELKITWNAQFEKLMELREEKAESQRTYMRSWNTVFILGDMLEDLGQNDLYSEKHLTLQGRVNAATVQAEIDQAMYFEVCARVEAVECELHATRVAQLDGGR